ncbi:hypothetical protein NQ314_009149 [Rhamnusium bicolor]|uniref:TPX2 central domain-containing protein n=1 Tax=Rhamnusium bicolor TaxID=1586634 RepID=A0AAV8Y430_9CUCU|nr:hypothetical protein NQ314_009149 [Rhamnusium bicolor]
MYLMLIKTSKSSLLEQSGPHILVSTPHTTSSLRIPSTNKKNSVQDVLRAKLSQIHVGLRKRRALSVQEFFHNPNQEKQPTFYVPSPTTPNSSENAQTRRPRSRQRAINSLTFTPCQSKEFVKCHSSEWDPLPYEPPPDYDEEEKAPNRRWSVIALNKPDKGSKNAAKIENFNIKIPKTKLNKPLDRARSQSPNWNKEQVKSIKGETQVIRPHFASKVANSKSHYELIGARQKPEARRDAEREREQQVCNCFKTTITSI